MAHMTRVVGRTVKQVTKHVRESETPGNVAEYRGEWVVMCDKCGMVDRADDPNTAEHRAARHRNNEEYYKH